MLRDLRVGAFKSYEGEQRLVLAPLTVLIGANASGKSNLIEALQLLAWLARSHRLGDLGHALRERELAIRGSASDLLPRGRTDLRLGCKLDTLVLDLQIRVDGQGARIVAEQLEETEGADSELPLYTVTQPALEHGSELRVAYNNYSRGKQKPQISCIDSQAVFTQLLTPARFDGKHTKSHERIPEACTRLADELGGMVFLDPQPTAMRDYCYLDERELYPNGSNVSAVLWQLMQAEREQEVLEFVRALPEQNIEAIQFLLGPRNDVMVKLVETFGGQRREMDAAVLSDGTLRVLAIAAAVLSVAPGSLVVIEEIDNGVHPSRAMQLMASLHGAAKRRNVQLLVTTHNPALLDAIPPAAIADTMACYRDPTTGASLLQRLGELDDFGALAARGPLGILATSGTLDRYLKNRRTKEERERQGQRTLELFRSAPE